MLIEIGGTREATKMKGLVFIFTNPNPRLALLIISSYPYNQPV
ncbi:hypothetical protein MARI151_30623 [Maribacter litoralis]|uniref:Uncharacterized protein n=1 Tax=Maribacter litoralis TaxID=2059726 RepID=A0A653TRA9_9FLAO|nr:hypothetical protein MARI151_30623 [Maribacter litoralis]